MNLSKHVVDTYKEWQPTFAAYGRWLPEHKDERRGQAILEMVGEAGEVLGVLQKARRKEHHIPRARLLDELGDTLWGLVGVMNEFDISWEEICTTNREKLEKRYQENGSS